LSSAIRQDRAILRALQQIQNLQLAEDSGKIAVVNRDSKVALDTLQNRNKHYTIIENIEKEIEAGGPAVDSAF
jgi:mannitol-1-phosphate/altronate dehydrogenase